MTEILHFVVTGEWVTKMARDLFWLENRSYKEVEKHLLNCMLGTTLPEATLKKYAKQVLLGTAKFIGRTDDDSFCLVKDETDIISTYKNSSRLLKSPFIDASLIEPIIDSCIRLENQHNKSDDLNINSDYGWLKPDGFFYPVPWAEHAIWALKYVQDFYVNDFSKYRREKSEPHITSITEAGDFLVYELGWILLHSPGQDLAFETRDPARRRTKAQTEFLFDYYIKRGRKEEAYALYQEG